MAGSGGESVRSRPCTSVSAGPQAFQAAQHHLNDSSPLMVNPTMAEDVDVLERHPLAHQVGEPAPSRPYIRISNTRGESIVYRNVPRQREGLQNLSKSGVAQREVMGHVLGTLTTPVLQLYFEQIHTNFPVVDRVSFWSAYERDPRCVSSTLICDMYAVAIPYWASSNYLRGWPAPDKQFAWNQAVLALKDDFMSPSMTTVQAAVLDLMGRPIYSTTGNIVTIGRTVTLAHSLGLHRDPSTWRMDEAERSSRVKLWWAVLIHDHWSSLAHGTPPNISNQYYDVPLSLVRDAELSDGHTTEVTIAPFYCLCWLTQILGTMLPLIYSLRLNLSEASKCIRRVECELDAWEDSLPKHLIPDGVAGFSTTAVSPLPALWFYFLSLRLVLQRLSFKIAVNRQTETQAEARAYRFVSLRSAAFDVVDFVATLRLEHYAGFWLPYTAYLLVSATTTLLRCAVESPKSADQRACSQKLSRHLDNLRKAHHEANWDLAQLCIETCAHSIESLATVNQATTLPPCSGAHDGVPTSGFAERQTFDATSTQDVTSAQYADQQFSLDLDIPWDHLWDDIGEPWRLLE